MSSCSLHESTNEQTKEENGGGNRGDWTFFLHFRAKMYRKGRRECRNGVDQCSCVGNLGILARRADNLVRPTSIKIMGWWVMMAKTASASWCLWTWMWPALCRSGWCCLDCLPLKSRTAAHCRPASWQRDVAGVGVMWWGQASKTRAAGQEEQ